jgi:hypothetical protein
MTYNLHTVRKYSFVINEDARTGVGEMLKAEELGYIPSVTMLTCSSILLLFCCVQRNVYGSKKLYMSTLKWKHMFWDPLTLAL